MPKKSKQQRQQEEVEARRAAQTPRISVGSVGQLITTLASLPRDAEVYGPAEFANKGDVCIHRGGKDLLYIVLTGL